ncbi:MAG: response regulator [Lachnospiraceae bacterium]|nr:response regulator [Lachnospiraceae bacterium]
MKKNRKGKEKRIIQILKILFGIMFLTVLLLLVVGELVMPEEDPTARGECRLLEAEWERVYAEGIRGEIEIPGRCEAERNEVVRIETRLPKNQENIWFCMRASQQDMRVYVGDELRQEYTTKETRLFGKDSASAFVFFEVYKEDAGKMLAIELVSSSEYSGFLNEVYVGEKNDIAHWLLRECAGVISVSVYMLILSTIAFAIGAILRWINKIKADITYLGLGIMQLSLAMIVESRIRQFFLPNVSVAATVGFLLTILVPYPFMVYVNRIQKGRYETAYRALSLLVALHFISSVVLQVLNLVDLADTMFVSYVLLLLMVLLIAVTIALDVWNKRMKEYGVLVIGFVTMLVVALWETYVTLVPETPYTGGLALSFGLIVLLFMAGIKTAKDVVALEQEKQVAIAAGEAKEKFLTNMSHEIRTPINTIIGMNEMILRENSSAEVEEYAKNVQNASRLLLGLINDILDFSKIEAGKMDILENDYYLSRMLTDIENGIRIKADNKALRFVVEAEEALPSVLRGDELRIRQILNNLLSNAIKYTNQGTVTLMVKGSREEDGFVLELSVADTGIGIKKEDMERLFGSFLRLEEQKNHYIEGTGLGLNITRQLVQLMGGSIEVQSEYGKGSCFTVRLPQQIVNEKPLGRLENAYQREVQAPKKLSAVLHAPEAKVLVVDDNEMNLAVVKALLKRTEIQLTLANGGAECLKLCRKQKFDLILMDHMMPKPDGIETLHRLKKDELGQNAETGVIVLTANAIAGMREKYIEEGFLDYLSKPVAAEELEEMLGKYLPEEKVLKSI